ncbi:methylmalonyl-CoA mutase family protein [Algoriphagus sp. CAU 1675]|uniref:methylmalonyl-CoA mutase family protein n=1 Tax=Algoriphagus sp. CAU 1675 TaxID=3032597 RepID=UPI0023DADCED|nr:methylmalonyl-CoA mutase family protein [Algoriphagus sp. CAU 1675]MDF2159239.1 methylmalonyl-CoA mutase family protein [Algoriphagus sp. CAU 1675]
MTKPDFYPFTGISKSEWKAKAVKDLKEKDFEKTLVSTLWKELKIQPYYGIEDKPAEKTETLFNPESGIPGLPPRIWSNAVSIFPTDPSSSNKEILHNLENGADSLIIHFQGNENLEKLLEGVFPEFIEINWVIEGNSNQEAFSLIKSWVEKKSIQKEQLKGSILWSPFDFAFSNSGTLEEAFELAEKLIEDWKEYPNFRPITLDFARYSNSGANGIQELTFGMGELIELIDALTEKGIQPEKIFQNLAFHTTAGQNHFGEIAKIKALRRFLVELAAQYKLEISPESIHLVVSSSLWSKTLMDKNSNLIRQTYEAMAAILGGCNTLWVRPLEETTASVMEKRIARNVSSILKEESYLDKVMDPSAGSYFLDSLETELIHLIRNKIVELEKRGGWISDFSSRRIHQEIRETRKAVQLAVLEGKELKVGTNKFPASGSLINNLPFVHIEEKEQDLQPSRASYLVELQNLGKL